jgi:hypothetical protein
MTGSPGLLLLVLALNFSTAAAEAPNRVKPWLAAQHWQRDTTGPVLALSAAGAFDDTHLLSPCVARERDNYFMWYSGSTGTVAQRVFHLGLAQSADGKTFTRHGMNPVLRMKNGKSSVLTPTVLRHADGSLQREDGKIRMWFSATDFSDKTGLHTLHETTSEDGIRWSEPSAALLQHVYAPSILKETDGYRLWYTDVATEPWVIRHASSRDGRSWQLTGEPVLRLDQKWESGRLFYPTVVKVDGVYLMWYGSYWSAQAQKTALGLAVSLDGVRWYKNPHNPVFTPDPARSWESHYTTSQSLMRFADGTWRIWYASRKQPPFVNKYFAIGTATWKEP